MSLFSKKEAPVSDARTVSLVFEVSADYDKRLIGKSKPVTISMDGDHIATLLPGESIETKVTEGRHKFKMVCKDGTTHTTTKIQGNTHCLIYEYKDETEFRWR